MIDMLVVFVVISAWAIALEMAVFSTFEALVLVCGHAVENVEFVAGVFCPWQWC